MKILGIDPGYARCGYGIIKHENGTTTAIDYGCFETDKNLTHAKRLLMIHTNIDDLIKTHHPDKVGVEDLFFAKNSKTAFGMLSP